jgi:hypothetical protein
MTPEVGKGPGGLQGPGPEPSGKGKPVKKEDGLVHSVAQKAMPKPVLGPPPSHFTASRLPTRAGFPMPGATPTEPPPLPLRTKQYSLNLRPDARVEKRPIQQVHDLATFILNKNVMHGVDNPFTTTVSENDLQAAEKAFNEGGDLTLFKPEVLLSLLKRFFLEAARRNPVLSRDDLLGVSDAMKALRKGCKNFDTVFVPEKLIESETGRPSSKPPQAHPVVAGPAGQRRESPKPSSRPPSPPTGRGPIPSNSAPELMVVKTEGLKTPKLVEGVNALARFIVEKKIYVTDHPFRESVTTGEDTLKKELAGLLTGSKADYERAMKDYVPGREEIYLDLLKKLAREAAEKNTLTRDALIERSGALKELLDAIVKNKETHADERYLESAFLPSIPKFTV